MSNTKLLLITPKNNGELHINRYVGKVKGPTVSYDQKPTEYSAYQMYATLEKYRITGKTD